MKRYLCLSLLALCATASAATTVNADTIKLSATVRDFQEAHPDFQVDLADDRDYVANTLGADGKPVYIGGAGTATTSGAANYNQWYNDTPGVNLTTTVDLVLDNNQVGPGGVYTFNSPSFFPIDSQLFGNENAAHNYYFTLELNTAFTYQPGTTFNVEADDDLIIFIDGQKVIDLGGVHPPQTASLDLDTLGRRSLVTELGDAFRSWCNPAGEDAEDATFSVALFSAAIAGYADGSETLLTAAERESIPAATHRIAVELAARFCADALNETFFRWDAARFDSASAHNLARTRAQLALAEQTAGQHDALRDVVAECLP